MSFFIGNTKELSFEEIRRFYRSIRHKAIFDKKEHRTNTPRAIAPSHECRGKTCDYCSGNRQYRTNKEKERIWYELKDLL